MKFTAFLFTVGLVRAFAIEPVLHESHVARAEGELVGRGLLNAACTYGDPLGGSSAWKYVQFCQSTSSCAAATGFSTPGWCDGGVDNQCCIHATCAAPYENSYCANTETYDGCAKWAHGYCPGPNNFECCIELKDDEGEVIEV